MQDSQTSAQMLTVRQVADRIGVSTVTASRMLKRGDIRAVRINDRGHFRISETALAEFIAQRESATAAACRCGRKAGCSR